jgi:hypothetical protein
MTSPATDTTTRTLPATDTTTRTLPATVQDFIAANFENPVSRTAKTQAALDTYACLWADERGDVSPDELASDVCQALLLDGEDMAVKLSLAVRDCIDREDAAWGGHTDETTCSCSTCKHHKSKSNPTPGKLIPGETGKCTRPEGLCELIAVQGEPQEVSDAPLVPEITPERGAALNETQHTAAAIDQAVLDSADVFKAIGRIEASTFFAKIGNISAAQFARQVREDKKYKGLPYNDNDGNRKYISTFDEFCDHFLGKTGRYVRDLIGNLRTLGSDLYESAERIGFRAKDYRALKALPEAEQAIVKQAIESESKEDVLAILEDMAAKHQAEREAAKREKDGLTADLDARGKLLEDKATRLEKTEEELFRLKSLPKDADQELRLAREAEAVKALENAYMTALVGWNEFLVQVEAILNSHDVSAHTSQHVIGSVGNYCQAINAALIQHNIPVDFEEEVSPAWMRETAQADLEAGQTNTPNGRSW